MRNRYRWMFYMTGLPGWMRFGFSPGWIGRSPYGIPPGAYYLMTGNWPLPFGNYFMNVPFTDPWGVWQLSPEEEIEVLKGQAEILEDQLDGIRKRIEELEKQK